MAEQVDISYVITNAVKDYIAPKHKIYRIEFVEIHIIEHEGEDSFLQSKISNKIIEVMDENSEDYQKIKDDKLGSLREYWINSNNEKAVIDRFLFNASIMSEEKLNNLIKDKLWRHSEQYNIVLLNYKQLA